MIFDLKDHTKNSIDLLRRLIATPSYSREEGKTADLIESFFRDCGCEPERQGNNVWVRAATWRSDRPTLLLNSHHDTVKPNQGYTRDPFVPTVAGDTLYGLGSNDAGGPLVSLIATFLELQSDADLAYNLILAATAEEEISGANGVVSILDRLGPLDCAIVGEPTSLEMAIAERGLMVLDGEVIGKSGHAAREEGVNALYLALEDIQRIRTFRFEQVSELLGPVKASVTQIAAGSQHNVVPDRCTFVVDVRVNELYNNTAVHEQLQAQMQTARLTPRSYRLRSSRIDPEHPLVRAGRQLGLTTYGSPTLSDQALLSIPSLKLGPGDSARSHTADEYIKLTEIEAGVATYCRLLRMAGR
jgi:acetylornithine deacetylase